MLQFVSITVSIKNLHHEFKLGKIQDAFFVELNLFTVMTEVANYQTHQKDIRFNLKE